MRIAGTVQDSIVDGPGLRYTVFTQGCPHACPGCHNPDTHKPDGGIETPVEDIIEQMLSNPLTDGVTLTGGEPFLQAGDCLKIAKAAHSSGLNVWLYSGFTYEELSASADAEVRELLGETDVLVDGRFILENRSLTLKWRGSANQRVIDVKKSLEKGCVEIVE